MTPVRLISLVAFCVAVLSCQRTLAQSGPRAPGTRPETELKVIERVYQKGLKNDWQDFGWANRKVNRGGPELLDMSNHGGWILAKPGLKGWYGGLVLRFLAPLEYGDFLEVRVESQTADIFPRIRPGPEHRLELRGGWSEVFLPMRLLNPEARPFDRVIIRAYRTVGTDWVAIDDIAFTAPSVSDSPSQLAGILTGPTKPVTMKIDCSAPGQAISPLIYGIAFSPRQEFQSPHQWKLGATARRWGGNPASRYNWELGNAWNTGADWFFRNVNYTGRPDYTYEHFLSTNQDFRVHSVLTVPMLGWVAKDTRSSSFPVEMFGRQERIDPDDNSSGNGVAPSGRKLEPASPTKTSVPAPPDFVGRWIARIRGKQKTGGPSVHMYILDNEPMLWHDTHRDVFPTPLSYDELLKRTLAYGTVVRKADPQALIAGPAEWGWPAYFYSAVDAEAGVTLRPDRRAHGDVPLIEWYLRKVREHEKKSGVKVLDILDLHFYPQAKGMGLGTQGRVDPTHAALRIRTTRALWDPSYRDESWIGEPVMLIPRMKKWVEDNSPGLLLSIGEYNFGAEEHISGGLALAEALGRFGQQGLYSAFYWTYPPENSPAFHAFRAYRNYDGKGAKFEGWSLPTTAPAGLSLFASRDDARRRVVAVALNLDPNQAVKARIETATCGQIQSQRVFTYAGGPDGLIEVKPDKSRPDADEPILPGYSISVIELNVGAPE